MDIVVTGGSGFVGRVLIPNLLTNFKNSKIINLDLNSYKLPNKNFSTIQTNITDLKDISKIKLESSSDYFLIHLAANTFNQNVPSRSNREKFFFDTNVVGTENILSVFKGLNLKKACFISTDMVYGTPRSIPVNTHHPLRPNGEYGESKVKAEESIITLSQEQQFDYFIFRPRLIIGPGRLGLLKKLFFLIKNNLPVPMIGSGKNRYQFISVFDCADALIYGLKSNQTNQIFNLGSNNPPRVKNLLLNLIKHANSKSILIPTFHPIAKVLLGILDSVNLSLMYPEQYLIADKDYVLDTASLKNELGFVPKDSDQEMLLEGFNSYLEI
tara:strand:+ start:1643 stop:2623 length:981 start_codon:yes stop_codon:yes gene_type:complete